MSANIEYQLLCKSVVTQDFHTVDKLKIDESFFLGESITKEVYRFLRDHYHNEHTYGSVPSWQILQQRFPGFPWCDTPDTLATLCQELRKNKIKAQMLSMVEDISNTVQTDPVQAMALAREWMNTVTSEHEITNDMLLSAAYEKLYEDYNMLANAGGVIGIPFPWECLNDDTQGMQKGQFIVLYGRPKSMKTWVGLNIATHAYLKGMRVLVWSLEMSEPMMLRRVTSILASVDYDKYKKAQLDPAVRDKVWQILMHIKDEELARTDHGGHSPALLVVHPKGGSNGIASLQAKIREFNPDLVLVDGMYLMRDDRQKVRSIDWKAVAHISQDLKQTASTFEIPVIGITQANRGADKDPKKADLAELAYADAIAQDCDLCMRVHKQKDQSTHEWEIVISIPGGRETQLDAFVIHGIASTNFGFKRAAVTDPNAPIPDEKKKTGGGGGGNNSGPPILPGWGRK